MPSSLPTSLHICHVVPYFYPAWAYGGIPRLAYGLSRKQVELGHRVTVITTDVFDSTRRLSSGRAPRVLSGIRVITLRNLSNSLAYHHQAFLPRGFLGLREELGTDLPHVYHLHGHRHLLNNIACGLALRQGAPYVLTPNGTLPRIERKQWIKRVFDLLLGDRVLKGAAAVVAVTRAEVAQCRAAGIAPDRVVEIPNGLELAEFEALPSEQVFRRTFDVNGPYVLYLGKLTPRKGVEVLIDAFDRLRSTSLSLVIAGNDMGMEESLRAQVSRLSLSTKVKFVGLLTGHSRLSALAGAEILAYPSSLEIFGLVPFEGLLAGTPVVVSDDCGCGEVVAASNAGIRVPYGDVEALVDALLRLHLQPALRMEYVNRGRTFIRQHLSWERIAPLTLEVYRSALRRSPCGTE